MGAQTRLHPADGHTVPVAKPWYRSLRDYKDMIFLKGAYFCKSFLEPTVANAFGVEIPWVNKFPLVKNKKITP